MEYDIVAHWSLSDFVAEVNRVIGIGWRPIGGVSVVATHDGSVQYYQAVVRVSPKESVHK